MEITPHDMRLGRERLTKLLPRAVADVAKGPWHAETMSAIARAQARHARSQNIEAAVVHRALLGGWFCDIVLREVPAGIARVFGTPVRTPHHTEAEAEAAALPMLTMVLAGARQVTEEDAAAGGPPPSARVFEYFGAVLEVPERLIGVLETIAGGMPGARYRSPTVPSNGWTRSPPSSSPTAASPGSG